MKKKKESKTFSSFFRAVARIFVVTLPTTLILLLLLIFGEISIETALLFFGLIFFITAVITTSVFKELENFISYLKTLAQQGLDIEPPRFHKGIFGSFRLADAFLSVKNIWSNQTLSDSSILENLPDPLLMINSDGEIVFANQISRTVFGENILHHKIFDLFLNEPFSRAAQTVLSETSDAEWFEWTYDDEEQSYTFQTRIERLPASARGGAIAVVTMHDITPFKRFKEQQSDFFANASHELKTPLSIISGFIETLQGPARNDEAARDKFLTMMAEQTDRMTRLVQDLLKLSHLQMTQKAERSDVVLMSDLLQSLVEDLKIKAAQTQKEISLKLVHDLPRLMGNRSELYRVFQNLIDNAIKYGRPETTITVKAQLCNGFPKKSDRWLSDIRQVIAISVNNAGDPIPPKYLARLFDRFYRVDSLKSRMVEGTGLGLGIAQQIVHEHDGIITVTSTAKDGTTFTVYLPVDF